jgi:hypothetical protein
VFTFLREHLSNGTDSIDINRHKNERDARTRSWISLDHTSKMGNSGMSSPQEEYAEGEQAEKGMQQVDEYPDGGRWPGSPSLAQLLACLCRSDG